MMSDIGMEDIECPECGGSGDGQVVPDCCGEVDSGGACRGDCVIPRQMPCEFCGGYGRVEF